MNTESINPILFVVAIPIVLAICGLVATRPKAILIPIGVMLFAASLGVARTKAGAIVGGWMLPAQTLRAEIYLAGGVLVMLGVLVHPTLLSRRHTSTQGWLFLAIALFMALLTIFHDGGAAGFRRFAAAGLTTLPLILVAPALLRKPSDFLDLTRVFMWVNVIWIFCVLVQLAIDPSRVTEGWHDRFVGLSGNSQHNAITIAPFGIIALWMAMNDVKRRYIWLWIGVFTVDLIMLLATGSRTGAAMLAMGAMAVLYRRWGKAILLLPFGLVAGWIVMWVISKVGLEVGFERVTSLEDTRSGAWMALIEQGMEAPVIGQGQGEVEMSENSYFWGFASFGIGFVFLVTILLLYSIWHCLTLLRAGHSLRRWRPMIDLFVGINAMYFAGAFLEGYIVLMATVQTAGLLVVAGMSASLLRAYHEGDEELLEDEPSLWIEDEASAEYDYAEYLPEEGMEYGAS